MDAGTIEAQHAARMAAAAKPGTDERREAALAIYRRFREDQGMVPRDALISTLYEYRQCSENELREWVKDATRDALPPRGAPKDEEEEPVATPLQEAVTDDLATASAPADGKWSFDGNVTAAFDDMLERSIPNYADMRKITTDAALWIADKATWGAGLKAPAIVDLGASRGTALQPLVDKLGARGRFFAYDVSAPMLEACYERFKGMVDAGIMQVRNHDLREGFPALSVHPSVILSILTLQFVPIEYRQTLLRQAYEALSPSGGLILVEKVLGEADETNRLLTDLYYGLKRENGYAQEAIDRKRMSLEGVLVPLTADFNQQLLRRAGFDLVEVCWAWANFRAWLCLKR